MAGATASVWLAILVAALAGWSHPPAWLRDGPTALLIYATLAYALGVVVDGAADATFTWMLRRGWKQGSTKPNPIARAVALVLCWRTGRERVPPPITGEVFQRWREAALLREDGLAKFMEYQRSRQRIARAVTLNLLLLLPIGIWFFAATLDVSAGLIAGFAATVAVGVLVSGRTAERLRDAYEGHLIRLASLGTDGPLGQIRAAAVCVRLTINGINILIVRTKEHESPTERWTFPKGHVEPGESLLEAAIREAEEEAGAKGVVERSPLPPYLFPEGPPGHAAAVIPFLVRPTDQAEPTEPGRAMRWASPEEAKALLRLNREAPFANEHDRVIDRAVEVMDRC